MKKITSILLLVIFSLSVNAQITFQKTFGGINNDEANYIQQTSDGGYIIAGSSYNFVSGFNKDAYLIKTDASGNMLWNKTYGNTCDEEATCVQQTFDGGYIISGYYSFNSISQHRGFLIKTNSTGDTIWTEIYGNEIDFLFTVRQVSDGGYIAGGQDISGISYGFAVLLRVDNTGNVLWSQKYGNGLSTDNLLTIYEVQQTTDGGYIASGNCGCGNCPLFLLKLNSAGITLWTKIYSPHLFSGNSVQQTFDEGYIIGGFYHSGGINDGAVFIKTDANGNIVWFKVYAMDNWGQVKYLRQTRSGEYISLLESNKIFALKIDASGNFLWCKKYQPTGGEQAQCIQQTNDDGFVFTGNGLQLSSYSCVFLIKTDSNGISGCNEMPFLISATSPSITVQNALCPITALNIVASPLPFIYVNSSATVESTLCATFVNDKSSSPNEISIYPNPMDNFFNLEFQADGAGLSKIELYNLLGQVVLEKNFQIQQGENKLSFEISIIPAGVYLLNIQTNKSSFVKMMIKK